MTNLLSISIVASIVCERLHSTAASTALVRAAGSVSPVVPVSPEFHNLPSLVAHRP